MNVWATTDCHRREPEVSLWQVCRPDLVTPVTRRSRKPLARIVANPPTEIEAAWASAQGSNGRFTSKWRCQCGCRMLAGRVEDWRGIPKVEPRAVAPLFLAKQRDHKLRQHN